MAVTHDWQIKICKLFNMPTLCLNYVVELTWKHSFDFMNAYSFMSCMHKFVFHRVNKLLSTGETRSVFSWQKWETCRQIFSRLSPWGNQRAVVTSWRAVFGDEPTALRVSVPWRGLWQMKGTSFIRPLLHFEALRENSCKRSEIY